VVGNEITEDGMMERIVLDGQVRVRMSLRDALRLILFYRYGEDEYAGIVGELCRVLSADEVKRVYEKMVNGKWEVV
jgi:hypothetical protein